ncbi:hypothetical protein D3C78_1579340 [compost metagenome]
MNNFCFLDFQSQLVHISAIFGQAQSQMGLNPLEIRDPPWIAEVNFALFRLVAQDGFVWMRLLRRLSQELS